MLTCPADPDLIDLRQAMAKWWNRWQTIESWSPDDRYKSDFIYFLLRVVSRLSFTDWSKNPDKFCRSTSIHHSMWPLMLMPWICRTLTILQTRSANRIHEKHVVLVCFPECFQAETCQNLQQFTASGNWWSELNDIFEHSYPWLITTLIKKKLI